MSKKQPSQSSAEKVLTSPNSAQTGAKKVPQNTRPDLLDNKLMGALGLRVKADEVGKIKTKAQKLWQAALDKDELWADGDFMDDVRQATLRGAHPAATLLFYALGSFLLIAFLWAAFSPIDEVARGMGQVIPSGNIQAVGTPEGGIVAEILVKSGDIVQPGQPLVRFDAASANAGVGEKEQRRAYLQAAIIRLTAEISGTETVDQLVFPPELVATAPEITRAAQQEYENRKQEQKSTLSVLAEQVEQKKQEASDARRTAGTLGESLKLANEELNLTKPIYASGAIPRSDILRLERAVVDARQQYNTAQLSIPASEAALREAEERLKEAQFKLGNDARKELGEAQDEFDRLGQSVQADVSRVDRTLLKSPVRAEVKDVHVNTIGQAVQPNTNVVELVPLEDSLLVQVEVKPKDIAFIRLDQPAKVKISAYDFSIYGGLEGKVEKVSPDTFMNEKKETFFKVQVRTDKNYVGSVHNQLPIKSGMVATVDIITGKKTVLQYLLKPINKARERAFSER